MNRLTKRIILVGPGASGKDHLADEFQKKGFKKCTPLTTRPMRNGEIEGGTYNFVSKREFESSISNKEFHTYTNFNEWMYGITIKSWAESDVFIMTPIDINNISAKDRKECAVVYLDMPEDIRAQRLMQRNDADKVQRRLESDKKDFRGYLDYDYFIKDPNFDKDAWVRILNKLEIRRPL